MKRFAYGIFALVLVLAIGWAGFWFWGAHALRQGLEGWFAERRAAGWQAEYSAFSVQGFPNRFDADWKDLSLADPRSRLAVQLPEFGLYTLSYTPHHLIAVAPSEIQIATPWVSFPLEDDDLRASLRLHPGRALELERVQMAGKNLFLGGQVAMSVADLSLAMAQDAATPARYRLGLEATGVTPPARILNRLGAATALPETLDEVKLDAEVTFTRPWDRQALNATRPQPRHIDLAAARIHWGALLLQASGTLDVDAQGRPDGELDLKAENWRQMLTLATKAHALDPKAAKQIEGVLGFMAGLGGDRDRLEAKITFRQGVAWLGILPLGPVPPLRLR
ncbi:DUF2125 domain-containing protein [Pseudooceanicola sp. CBS1P-1]|uniref:DUF2125 domain-containing protein n=1 Tax=Pseudooceanicola albus TaxID=2692189 RepID=A0A6L7G4A6_9RHOB|nr:MULTISPECIES: DUF2125 domain-containing protein [Pseudooceanicola]MBT9384656.1 DUF2125 domain-containing protein [Pseudooceanicola endophyticus]MXN18357.1 DUF2125 domain-containing protein [Pseudooceanicola albus]